MESEALLQNPVTIATLECTNIIGMLQSFLEKESITDGEQIEAYSQLIGNLVGLLPFLNPERLILTLDEQEGEPITLQKLIINLFNSCEDIDLTELLIEVLTRSFQLIVEKDQVAKCPQKEKFIEAMRVFTEEIMLTNVVKPAPVTENTNTLDPQIEYPWRAGPVQNFCTGRPLRGMKTTLLQHTESSRYPHRDPLKRQIFTKSQLAIQRQMDGFMLHPYSSLGQSAKWHIINTESRTDSRKLDDLYRRTQYTLHQPLETNISSPQTSLMRPSTPLESPQTLEQYCPNIESQVLIPESEHIKENFVLKKRPHPQTQKNPDTNFEPRLPQRGKENSSIRVKHGLVLGELTKRFKKVAVEDKTQSSVNEFQLAWV